MHMTNEQQFNPCAVFELPNGLFVARSLEFTGGEQVSRMTNEVAAVDLADHLNQARKEEV